MPWKFLLTLFPQNGTQLATDSKLSIDPYKAEEAVWQWGFSMGIGFV